jgi:hypothetical protein
VGVEIALQGQDSDDHADLILPERRNIRMQTKSDLTRKSIACTFLFSYGTNQLYTIFGSP